MRKGLVIHWFGVAIRVGARHDAARGVVLAGAGSPPGQQLPATTQVGVPQGAPQAPAPAQPPAPPAKPTPRWPDGKPMMGAAPGEKGLWGSCCGNLAASNKTTPTFKPWAKMVYEDRAEEPAGAAHPVQAFRRRASVRDAVWHRDRGVPRAPADHGVRHRGTAYVPGHLPGWPASSKGSRTELLRTLHRPLGRRYAGGRTVGFNERAWIDRAGSPHTEKLRFIERFTRTDSNTMKYEVTIDDPGAYTATWSTSAVHDDLGSRIGSCSSTSASNRTSPTS